MRAVASLLFLVSLAVSVAVAPGTLVAYDAAALLIVGLLVAWLLAWLARAIEPTTLVGLVGVGAALAAGALSSFWLLSNNWAAESGSVAALNTLGRQWQSVRPSLGWEDAINDNVLAGGLGVLMPLAVGGLIWAARRPRLWQVLLWLLVAPALLLALAATALSDSRGAWLALIVAAGVGVYLAARRSLARRLGPVILAGDIALVVFIALPALLIGAALVLPGFDGGPLGSGAVGGTATSRVTLWREGLGLIGDYRFTGAGLGNTMMVLSSYVFILHVGFLGHLHNLFLEMALEQGLPGLIAYVCLAATAVASLIRAYHRRTLRSGLLGAAAASMTVLYVHGLVDAGLYVSKLAPLVFLPIGVAWAASATARPRERQRWQHAAAGLALATVPLLLVLALFAWPGARGAFQANLGAVTQTKAELSQYRWPEWPIQDALRRSSQIDLAPAIQRYSAALAADPNNVTAHRRLGQIALSQGDWVGAQRHLEAALRLAPEQNATRMLLGEVYAMTGDPTAAAALLRTVDAGAGQLDGRAWWISQVTGPQEQAWYAEARTRMTKQ